MTDIWGESQAIDQNTLDTRQQTYPFAQWVNGQPANKQAGGVPYTGGWFVNGEQVSGDTFDGWAKGTLFHASGGESEGFFARDLSIAIVHVRHCWTVTVGTRTRVFPWSQYDQAQALGAVTGKTQALGLVRGLEDFGPMFITVKGSAGKALTGKGGILEQFDSRIISAANSFSAKRGNRNRWARRAFWLTIGPQRDDKGAPIYTTVGQAQSSSRVTLPIAIGIPEKASEEEVAKLYVGAALLATLNQLYVETTEWAHAWDADALARGAATQLATENNGEGETKPEEEIPF